MTTQSHEHLARRMYSQWAGNQDIHCNRMPTWDELSENEKRQWLSQAAAIGEQSNG